MEELAPYTSQTKEDIDALKASSLERKEPETYEPNLEKAVRIADAEKQPRELGAIERETARIAIAASTEKVDVRHPRDTSVLAEYIDEQTHGTNEYRAKLTTSAVINVAQRVFNKLNVPVSEAPQEVATQANELAQVYDEGASEVGDAAAKAHDVLYRDKK